jgi:hypothetical protein
VAIIAPPGVRYELDLALVNAKVEAKVFVVRQFLGDHRQELLVPDCLSASFEFPALLVHVLRDTRKCFLERFACRRTLEFVVILDRSYKLLITYIDAARLALNTRDTIADQITSDRSGLCPN